MQPKVKKSIVGQRLITKETSQYTIKRSQDNEFQWIPEDFKVSRSFFCILPNILV